MTFDIEREARAFLDKRNWTGRTCTPGDLIDFGRMAYEAGAREMRAQATKLMRKEGKEIEAREIECLPLIKEQA